MGHPFPLSTEEPQLSGRPAEAYAFICDCLVRGYSPSIGELAAFLGVSRTRAKALIHYLANKQAIERAPGAQRAISIPGLFDQLVIDKLRQKGWKVDRDIVEVEPCTQGHLHLIAILEHIPAIVAGDPHDQSEEGAPASHHHD